MSKSKLVVSKFGGTSVDGPERLQAIARSLVRQVGEGQEVVVVVSAMGDQTDDLLELVRAVNPNASRAHQDMVVQTGEVQAVGLLAAAIEGCGGQAVALTSQQLGFVGSNDPGNARLERVKGVSRVRRAVGEKKIVVVPGFQAVADGGQLVTLGRGGSDLTAVALAIVLRAYKSFLGKDVPGLFPIDPRLVPDAICLEEIDYDQALALAPSGVVMARCIRLAQAHGMPIEVGLSPSIGRSKGGTIIRSPSTSSELEPRLRNFTAIHAERELALIEVERLRDAPGQAARIFHAVRNVCLGDAIQARSIRRSATISILVKPAKLDEALDAIRPIHRNVRGTDGYVSLTVADRRMQYDAGYMDRVTRAMARAHANINMLATSGTTILVACRAESLVPAARSLATEFHLRRKAA